MILRGARTIVEPPTLLRQRRLDNGNRDNRVQSFQLSGDQRSGGPGADVSDVEMIALRFSPKPAFPGRSRGAIRGYPIAEAGCLADKATLFVFSLDRLPIFRPLTVYEQNAFL